VVAQRSEAVSASSPSAQGDVSTVPTVEPVSPITGGEGDASITGTPASRLADAIRDLVQSTLSAQQSVAAERLIKTIEDRMAQTQQEVLDGLSEQVKSLVSVQTSLLKQRAEEIVSQSQQSLSAQLQQMTGAAGESAKAGQDKAIAAVESAMEDLHRRVAEQLPQTQTIFLDQCRSLAEQSLSGIVENALRTLSQRIEEANRGIDRLEERMQTILLDVSTQMDQNAAIRTDQAIKHMEKQLKEMAQRVYVNLQQYSVAELAGRQQAVEAAFRKQMQEVSEASLQEAQGALARMLHGLAEKMRPAPGQVGGSSNTP
jgi:phage-related protein